MNRIDHKLFTDIKSKQQARKNINVIAMVYQHVVLYMWIYRISIDKCAKETSITRKFN